MIFQSFSLFSSIGNISHYRGQLKVTSHITLSHTSPSHSHITHSHTSPSPSHITHLTLSLTYHTLTHLTLSLTYHTLTHLTYHTLTHLTLSLTGCYWRLSLTPSSSSIFFWTHGIAGLLHCHSKHTPILSLSHHHPPTDTNHCTMSSRAAQWQ